MAFEAEGDTTELRAFAEKFGKDRAPVAYGEFPMSQHIVSAISRLRRAGARASLR